LEDDGDENACTVDKCVEATIANATMKTLTQLHDDDSSDRRRIIMA
jgi:hypothetical protein